MLKSITGTLLCTPGPGWRAALFSYDLIFHYGILYEDSFGLDRINRDLVNAPVKCIDEILALPYSVDDFKGQEVPPSDDDSWLYNGEEELNSALMERPKDRRIWNDLSYGKE
ncbi:Ecd family [Sesbania bispinosa]|nr:Ecd family [Sesbania bispinosa]